MLCRAILTAIAISYVICVLLLSGLQKEELDANTMEKLQRHNVNIYDMNNESLRQECLLKSLDAGKSTQDYEIIADKNDTSITPINKPTQNEGINEAVIQTSEKASPNKYFKNKDNLRTLIDELKDDIQREQNVNDNIATSTVKENNPDHIYVTIVENKEPQYDYLKNQPFLESVMKFWTNLSRKSTEAKTEGTTTNSPPRTEEVVTITVNSDNKVYVHSREKEYMNKIIAEYLRSARQTEPTTTQVLQKQSNNIDFITNKINELLAKKAKGEIDTITSLKNMEDTFNENVKAMSDITDFGKVIQTNNKDRDAPIKAVHVQPKIINYDNIEQLKQLQAIPYNPVSNISPRPLENKLAPKLAALRYLDDMLRLNKETNTDSAPIYPESSTKIPIINRREPDIGVKRINGIRYYTEDANNTNKDSSVVHVNGVATDQVSVSADMIQTIAEKVKEIVMKDIRKGITTTDSQMSYVAMTIRTTTNMPATVETAPPYKEGSQVVQKLMELFNEFKSMKETTNAPLKVTLESEKPYFRVQPSDHMYPPVMGGVNPYGMKTSDSKIGQIEGNPYGKKFIQIPLSPAERALQAVPYNPKTSDHQQYEYRVPPITIQTNSAEIAPLGIQVSKPRPVLNQHIILTTPNPFEVQKMEHLQRESKQKFNNKFPEVLGRPNYEDLTKKLRIAENIKKDFRETYKDRIQKLKERIRNAHDQNRDKARELSRILGSGQQVDISRLLEPNYQDRLRQIIGSGHFNNALNRHYVSNPQETLSRPINSNNHETFSRPLDPNLQQTLNRQLDPNHHDSLNRPLNVNLHESLNRGLDTNNRESFSRPLESDRHTSLNQPVDLTQYANMNRPEDPNQRDIITREVLSRLVGSNHHDVISRLGEPSPQDVIDRPADLNHQSRSHHSDAYERIEHERTHPRYKGTRFHEELERIENLSRNNYGNTKAPTSCCDLIAARQQMPLNKLKQRARFDDTHFRNFLKSQQKVTDMLERILASKTKTRPQSVETP